MKKSSPVDAARFSGNLRHYHRGSAQTPRSWDDWVDGRAGKPRGKKCWGKVVGLIASVVALIGIVTGLVVELG